MKLTKSCPECGYVLNGTETSCPECGYVLHHKPEQKPEPAPEQKPEPEPAKAEPASSHQSRSYVQPEKLTPQIALESTENYYSVDFNWFEKLSSDPWLLTFLQDVGWLRWLCAPWHIGGYGKKDTDHVIANDIFFILNRLWKLYFYPQVWAAIKALPIVILLIVIMLITGVSIFGGDSYGYGSGIALGMGFGAILYIAFWFMAFWLLCIGIGKSCKRYGIPLIHAVRHLCAVFVNSIKN